MAVRISSRVNTVKNTTSTAKKSNKVSSSTKAKAKSSSKGTVTKSKTSTVKTTSKAKINVTTKLNKVSTSCKMSTNALVPSSTKQSTNYLKDAPKLYTSSGLGYSYGRPEQSYKTSSQTSSKTSTVVSKSGTTSNTANVNKQATKSVGKGTNLASVTKINSKTKVSTAQTTPKSISFGRPAESYIEENKVKNKKSEGATSKLTTKSNSVSLPKTTQVPIQKKSTKSNSDKIKVYEPTNSRSGAGKYSYEKKTSPTGAKKGASLIASTLPIVGDAKDVQEAITGKDLVTGKNLSKSDRIITAAAIVVPVVSGKSVNTTRKAIKSPTVKSAVKSGTKKLKQSTSEIVKKAKSGIQKTGKEIVDSVKKGAKDKTEDVKKKTPTKEKENVKIDGGKSDSKVKMKSQIRDIQTKNPEQLIEDGWKDVTNPKIAANTESRELYDLNTGLKIRFDKGVDGANGFEAVDHYHVMNEKYTNKKVDYYLDIDGNPVGKGSRASHIVIKK